MVSHFGDENDLSRVESAAASFSRLWDLAIILHALTGIDRFKSFMLPSSDRSSAARFARTNDA